MKILRSIAMCVAFLGLAGISLVRSTSAFASADSGGCGTGGCGQYYVEYLYAGGGTSTYTYSHQWYWMRDATNGIGRGVDGSSDYAQIFVGDIDNSFRVGQTYRHEPPFNAYSYGDSGDPTGWIDGYHDGTGCPPTINARRGTEAYVWAYYMRDAAEVYVYHASMAKIFSPQGNTASPNGC